MPTDSDPKIDLRLFAQIHDDPFLTGTFELQGERFARSIQYLLKYVDQRQECPSSVDKLKPILSYLADVEQKMIPGGRAVRDTERLLTFASSITNDLQKLPVGGSLAIPGGWNNQSDSGHGMVYQFTRTAEGLEFSIYNAGSGADYHERRSAKDRELFYPTQVYAINLATGFDVETKNHLNHFIRALMIPFLPHLRTREEDIRFNAQKLYEEVLPQVYHLDAKLVSSQDKTPHALTGGQLSGTCAVRCLFQMLKSNFSSLEEYQRFIYDFKRYALDDFMQELLRSGKRNHIAREVVEVKQAINTLKRTLTLFEGFKDDFIEREIHDLNHHLHLLDGLQDDSPAEKRVQLKGEVLDIDANLRISKLPAVLVAAQNKQPHDCYSPIESLDPIRGGPDLFTQLNELEAKAKRFMAAGQYQAMIEGLEAIFVNFPISPDEKDYFQAINQENQVDFYKIINRLHGLYLKSVQSVIPDAALPRMWAVSLSVISVLDTVSHPLSFGEKGDPTFRALVSISNLTQHNVTNAYLATNNPKLDERIASIYQRYRTLYQKNPRSFNEGFGNVKNYYSAILNSEPSVCERLKREFHTRFPWKTQSKLGESIVKEGLQAL